MPNWHPGTLLVFFKKKLRHACEGSLQYSPLKIAEGWGGWVSAERYRCIGFPCDFHHFLRTFRSNSVGIVRESLVILAGSARPGGWPHARTEQLWPGASERIFVRLALSCCAVRSRSRCLANCRPRWRRYLLTTPLVDLPPTSAAQSMVLFNCALLSFALEFCAVSTAAQCCSMI